MLAQEGRGAHFCRSFTVMNFPHLPPLAHLDCGEKISVHFLRHLFCFLGDSPLSIVGHGKHKMIKSLTPKANATEQHA